jgi:hypothetical protein
VTPEVWFLALVVAFLLLLAWTIWTLTRLRRLEARVARAWTALDTQLQRRAGLAEDRELAENVLGRELRELPAELPGVPTALHNDLVGTTTRVGLARRFYNDAVRDTRALRRGRLSLVLRLHGSRPLPRFFDIDDRLDDLGSPTDGAGRSGR